MKSVLSTYRGLSISLLLICSSSILSAQFLPNPSFEGPGGENQPPEPWITCESSINHPDGGDHSTIAVDLPASHGESYLSMRVRGQVPSPEYSDFIDTREFCATRLLRYLKKNVCYTLSVDLAYDDSVIYFSEYVHVLPTIFRVWGTYDGCTGVELLAESELIDNTDWETFQFIISPQNSDYDSLYFEPYYAEEVLQSLGTSDDTYNGILLVDNITINEEYSIDPSLLLDTLVWPGDQVILNAGEGSNYVWDYSDDVHCTNCQSQEITASSDNTYRVTYKDDRDCPIQELFNVSVLSCEAAYSDSSSLRLDTTLTEPTALTLRATEGESYSWSPANVVSCADCRETEASIDYSIIIESTVSDEHECIINEVFRVIVEISYSNVITPNGDTKNEVFHVRGLPPNSTFKVFTRSGTLIAKTFDYQNNWAGRNQKGEAIPEDTYWFTLTNEEVQLNESGYILLKR